MTDIAKEILALGHSVIRRARLSNAMGTPLVLIALVTVPCIVVYAFTTFWPILILAAAPVILFAYAFNYLMRNNPNLLRTEEHEEKMMQLSAGLGRKGKELTEQDIDHLPAVTPAQADHADNKKIEGKK